MHGGRIPSFLSPSSGPSSMSLGWEEQLLPSPQHLQEVPGPSLLAGRGPALQDQESGIRRTQASEVAGGLS